MIKMILNGLKVTLIAEFFNILQQKICQLTKINSYFMFIFHVELTYFGNTSNK